MVVPDSIRDKVGPMPDVSSMSKGKYSRILYQNINPQPSDDLSALCMKLYDQTCSVFQEKYHMDQQVKKRDAEIHNLEIECMESHGSFKVPKLKKVNRFKMETEEK